MAEDVALVIDGELALLSGPVRRLAAQVDQLVDPELARPGGCGRGRR